MSVRRTSVERVREVNQRWLSTMGLDDYTMELRRRLAVRVDGATVTGRRRPSWWHPFQRRRWDRTVATAQKLACEETIAQWEAGL